MFRVSRLILRQFLSRKQREAIDWATEKLLLDLLESGNVAAFNTLTIPSASVISGSSNSRFSMIVRTTSSQRLVAGFDGGTTTLEDTEA